MNTLIWNPDPGQLTLSDELVELLNYPYAIHLIARADGLILRDHNSDEEVDSGVLIRTFPGEEDLLDASPAVLPISAEEAQRLRFPTAPRRYICWEDRDEDAVYALPEATPDAATVATDEVPVTLGLRPLEIQVLEALALRHGVRMVDILTAFASDLAAAQPRGLIERLEMRSGGSDEREMANDWFRRNVDPIGLEDEGPLFLRGADYGE